METERKYFGYSEGEVLDSFHSRVEMTSNNPKRLNEETTLETLVETSKNLSVEDEKYVKRIMQTKIFP